MSLRFLIADAGNAACALLMVFTAGQGKAEAQITPYESKFEQREDYLLPEAKAQVASGAKTVCGVAFREKHAAVLRLRTRFELPVDRPWLLLSLATCSGATCEPFQTGATLVSVRFDPAVEPFQQLSEKHGLGRDPAHPAMQEALEAYDKAISDESLERVLRSVPRDWLPQGGTSVATADVKSKSMDPSIWSAPIIGAGALHILVVPDTQQGCEVPLRTGNLLLKQPPPSDNLQLGGDSRPPGPRSIAAPGEQDSDSLAQDFSQRVVRIEEPALTDDTDANGQRTAPISAKYCSGVLLSDGLVLTARHCIAEACFNDPRSCQKYSIDIGFFRRGQELGTASILRAITAHDESSDYAILILHETTGLPMTSLTHGSVQLDTRFRLMLSHPAGHPVTTTNGDCMAYHETPEHLYHTCFALDGSSGAPIWARKDNNAWLTAIHSGAVLNCDPRRGDAAERESSEEEAYKKGTSDMHPRPCAGDALPICKIHRKACIETHNFDRNVCRAIASAAANSCQDSVR